MFTTRAKFLPLFVFSFRLLRLFTTTRVRTLPFSMPLLAITVFRVLMRQQIYQQEHQSLKDGKYLQTLKII